MIPTQRRGQAYDVYRLVVAAVIAGAILMVLLSIVMKIPGPVKNPDDFVRQAIGNMAESGGARQSEFLFQHGDMINLASAAAAGAIDVKCISVNIEPDVPWSCDQIQVACTPNNSGGDCSVTCTIYLKKI